MKNDVKNFLTVDLPVPVDERKKIWQSLTGIGVFILFIISSIFVNITVQALNKAAGSYGYYSGTYGYYSSSMSSDDVPAAPTSLTQSNVSTTTLTLGWTAPTTTQTLGTAISTGGGSIASYKIGYSTGTVSSCTSGTATTSTTNSVSLTGLDSNTTYNVKVCAVDNNLNTGTALSGTFTTASGGGSTGTGGGGGNAGSVFSTPSTTTVSTPTGTTISPAVTSTTVIGDAATLTATLGITRNTGLETAATGQLATVLKQLKLDLPASVKTVAVNIIAYGFDAPTIKLGLGERKNIVREVLIIFNGLNPTTVSELASGKIPKQRNLGYERKNVAEGLPLYVKATGHRPNFKVASENRAWNMLQYPIRVVARDIAKEREAVKKLKKILGRNPQSTLEWQMMRAIAYEGLKTK